MAQSDDLRDFIRECREEFKASNTFRGRVDEFMSNSNAHIMAVSKKVDNTNAKLDSHSADKMSHSGGFIGIVIAAIAGCVAVYKGITNQ